MCEPTMIMTALGVAKGAAGLAAQDRNLTAQGHQVNSDASRSYTEANYNYSQEARISREEGYNAEMEKRKAMGIARVRNSNLGIRGVSANETVTEQQRIGDYNRNTAKDGMRVAQASNHININHTDAAAQTKIDSLEAQAPSMFERIITMGAGGLQGYNSGLSMQASLDGT